MRASGQEMIDAGLRRTAINWLWGGVGFTTAAASAAFATYMAVFGPAGFGHRSPPDFASFATLTRLPMESQANQALHGPAQTPRGGEQDSQSSAAASAGPIDFAPTGTVGDTKDDHKVDPNTRPQVQSGTASLPAFVLRDVFDGKALVESRTSLALVAPGSTLEGAGEVLSIERRGDAWVVTTTHGIITTASH